MNKPVNIERVREYFDDPKTVDHYARAVANVGLWDSEEIVFTTWLEKAARILDLGCGAGRIAIGLTQLGFERVDGADYAKGMVDQAKAISRLMGMSIAFRQANALDLPFDDASRDAVIFGFNGLTQIPGADQRLLAMKEVCRILRKGGRFVFTTLDRESLIYSRLFEEEDFSPETLVNGAVLLELGDRHFQTNHGTTFIHVPTRCDVVRMIDQAGFALLEDGMRSQIAWESERVNDFADDCRFWIAEKR